MCCITKQHILTRSHEGHMTHSADLLIATHPLAVFHHIQEQVPKVFWQFQSWRSLSEQLHLKVQIGNMIKAS